MARKVFQSLENTQDTMEISVATNKVTFYDMRSDIFDSYLKSVA